jgi:The  BURPS668_1122 family of deaminases
VLLGEGNPTTLIEAKNIFRGFSSDYTKAKNLFKQFRENQIYLLKKKFTGVELSEQIQMFDKRNLAYFEGNVGNVRLSSSEIKVSGSQFVGEKMFDAYKIDKGGGIGTEGAWSREIDTEYVGLSEIARKYGAKKGAIFPDVEGKIVISSELPYCISCQGVIQDFANMFPKVKIYLVDGLKNAK